MPLPADPSGCVDTLGAIGCEGLFIAGIRERNPDLMERVLDALVSDREVLPVGDVGLPATRARLQEMVRRTREIAAARAALHDLARWIAPDDPASLGPLR